MKSIDESSGNSYTWRGPADVLIPERSEALQCARGSTIENPKIPSLCCKGARYSFLTPLEQAQTDMSENYLGLTSEVINHYKEREKHYLSKSVEGFTIKPSGQTVPERHDGGSPVAHGK